MRLFVRTVVSLGSQSARRRREQSRREISRARSKRKRLHREPRTERPLQETTQEKGRLRRSSMKSCLGETRSRRSVVLSALASFVTTPQKPNRLLITCYTDRDSRCLWRIDTVAVKRWDPRNDAVGPKRGRLAPAYMMEFS